MPLISVLMSVYKEPAAILTQAINSVLVQTIKDFEYIIILDNPDGKEQRIVLEEAASNDSRIKLLFNSQNLGLAESLNKAAELATGLFFCRMDADDISRPRRFEVQLNYLKMNSLDLVGGFMDVIDEKGLFLYKADSIPVADPAITQALAFNNCLPHPTWFGRREILSLKYRQMPYTEDYDFLLRAALSGIKLGNCPEIVLSYRMSRESISRTNLYRQFLYQVFLSRSFKRGVEADVSEAEEWTTNKWKKGKAGRYAKANRLFNEGYQALACGEKRGLVKLLSIPFISHSYCAKLLRMIRAKFA